MRTSRITRLALAAVGAALLAAPAAQAGSAFQFGTGHDPSVAMDPATGTAHVVWADQPDTQILHYCQIPRGATACQSPKDLLLDDANPIYTAGEPKILRDPATGTLYVIVKRYVAGDTYVFESTTGGATWSPKRKIYNDGAGTEITDPVLGPGAGRVTVGSWNPGRFVVSPKLDGTESALATRGEPADGTTSFASYDFAVAPTGDGGLIGVSNDLTKTWAWRLGPLGNPITTGDWGLPAVVGDGADSRVAGGPSGAFALGVVGGGAPQVAIRKWLSGTNFGAAVTAAQEEGREPDLTVGPSGAIAAVWRLNTTGNYQMRTVLSTDGGATFSAPYTFSDDPGLALHPQVALAQDNQGLVVWQTADKGLKAATLTPLPVPAPTPTPTPAPTPIPVGTPVPVGRSVTSTVPGASISFGVPKTCVQPGSTFTVKLTWQRKKRKGNLFVKINRADFYIGTKVVKIDKKAPFTQTLTVTASAKRGSTISLRARAYIKVKRGKAPKKSIKATIKVCA